MKEELKEEILCNHVNNKIISSGLGVDHFAYHMGSPGFQPRKERKLEGFQVFPYKRQIFEEKQVSSGLNISQCIYVS